MSEDNDQDAEGEETRGPELGEATTTEDESGDGAESRGPEGASEAEGADKRGPAKTDDTRKDSPKPFDQATAIDDIIAEVDGELAKDEAADEADAKPDEKTGEDEAKPDDKPEADEAKDDDAEPEAKDEDADADKSDAEKPDVDPDEPTAEELAKYPKQYGKQIKRAWDKVKKLRPNAQFGETVTRFAKERNIEPEALRDGLFLVADVVNAKDPEAAFDRLADEAISLVEGKNPDDMSPKEKAAVLRRMASRLAPEEKPEPEAKPEEVKLPEKLQDLVDTGELTLEEAKAAYLVKNPPKRKETPKPPEPAAPEKDKQAEAKRRSDDLARTAQTARENRARDEVRKVQVELAKTYKETWAKIAPVVKKALAEYKGAAPELWPRIVRDQIRIAAKQFERPPKKVGRTLTPTTGVSSSDKRDDLDRIMDEA